MKCVECGEKYSTERRRVTVQYLTGDFEKCEPCLTLDIEQGLVMNNPMDFLVGRRMYYKGYVSIGVRDHIKRVFDERMRVAS